MTNDRTAEVFSEISRSGYYPEVVAEGLRDAVADESVRAFVLHHEPTFDRDEIRRHERLYYAGIMHERRAKAQLKAGQPPYSLMALFDHALNSFAEAERIRPAGNDDAILRWNRCVRLLQDPAYEWGELEQELVAFDAQETPARKKIDAASLGVANSLAGNGGKASFSPLSLTFNAGSLAATPVRLSAWSLNACGPGETAAAVMLGGRFATVIATVADEPVAPSLSVARALRV